MGGRPPIAAALAAVDAVSARRGLDTADRDALRAAIEAALADAAPWEDMGPLGRGGMGEVRRVLDVDLDRPVALKAIREDLANDADAVARFIEEARTTARLEHPSIIPVYSLGSLADGRPCFTMKEVRGRTLGEAIREAHDAGPPSSSDRAFRRLLEILKKTCEAIAYAHDHGIIHRDLKPANVMLGDFGEVLVVDWGLALAPTRAAPPGVEGEGPRILMGGTPAYMPPEQVRGQTHLLGPPADVYALGAILYEILAGRPPYHGPDPSLVLAQVLTGPPPPPSRASSEPTHHTADETLVLESDPLALFDAEHEAPPALDHSVPGELEAICLKAMARDPAQRYPEAGAMGAAIEAWLDGVWKADQAHRLVAEADALLPRLTQLRAEATALRAEAQALLSRLNSWDPVALKAPGWTLEDRAHQQDREADLLEARYIQSLQGALGYDPDLDDAHRRLADYHQRLHAAAEAAGDEHASIHHQVLLGGHDRGAHAAWLRGDGTLTLVTDPPGAEVLLSVYAEAGRRLVPIPLRGLGRTPLFEVPLPRGSYLLEVRAPGRLPVLYPVNIDRLERWDGCPPGSTDPFPIYLPRPGEVGLDECYVPAGWFHGGGDPQAWHAAPSARVWVDGFVVKRFPVSNAEMITFLDDLVATGREAEALRWQPRERGTRGWEDGNPLFARGPSGRFLLVPDSDGDVWLPDHAVCMLTWAAATAFSTWRAARDQLPWRLPAELEWEKAARGVDKRTFPWGHHLDNTWACVDGSHAARPEMPVLDSFPGDESPYGVRGMAGNVRDWVRDALDPRVPLDGTRVILDPADDDPERPRARCVLRGGCWDASPASARCASRASGSMGTRGFNIGMRLARSLGPKAPGLR